MGKLWFLFVVHGCLSVWLGICRFFGNFGRIPLYFGVFCTLCCIPGFLWVNFPLFCSFALVWFSAGASFGWLGFAWGGFDSLLYCVSI